MKNRELLLEKINNTNIGEEINLLKFNHYYLTKVKFTQEPIRIGIDENISGKYGWIAECNSNYSYRTVFPMKNNNYVAFFKTLKNAKRNFIKKYLKKEK